MGGYKKIKRVYVPFWEWEDYLAGMWDIPAKGDYGHMLDRAVEIVADPDLYGAYMLDAVWGWPKTMLNSLTNTSCNRLSFIGRCGVMYRAEIPECITREAWGIIGERQRREANEMASKALNAWTYKHLQNEPKGEGYLLYK